jgi:thiamine pyrophosphate-dependent acetolactate synthase large subunit-like protein
MDMLIEANILKVAEILEAVGFKNINVKNAETIEAKLKEELIAKNLIVYDMYDRGPRL